MFGFKVNYFNGKVPEVFYYREWGITVVVILYRYSIKSQILLPGKPIMQH